MDASTPGTTPRRSLFRFSLRELLLVMLAVGAFVGWGMLLYERSQRYEPSSLFEQAPYWREDIVAALDEVGEKGSLTMPFAITYADGPSSHHSESYSFALTAANSDAFLQAFRARVYERLSSAGCKVRGEAEGNSGFSRVTAMSYRLESRVGAVHICAFKNVDDRERIVVTMHEERAWRGGLGAGITAGS